MNHGASRRRLRGSVKLAAFAVVTGVLYGIHVLTVPLLNLLRLPGHRWSAVVFRTWACSVARAMGMRIRVEGRPPRPPFFLVSNHLGYVDVVALASQLGGTFVARADAAGWPLFGALCRATGTIFVDRDRRHDVRRAMERIEAVLSGGRGVVLFPEGTSSGGDEVLAFRPSLLEPAIRADLPVSYATLTYETPPGEPPARTAVCWWGDMELWPHLVDLFRLRGFQATIRFGERALREPDRKLLAMRLREAVTAQLPRAARDVPEREISDRITAGFTGSGR